MKCCECNNEVSLFNMSKIINPRNFKCSNCKAQISLNNKGVMGYYIFSVLIMILLGVYLFLVKEGIGSFLFRNLLFWGCLIPLSVGSYVYVRKLKTITRGKKT